MKRTREPTSNNPISTRGASATLQTRSSVRFSVLSPRLAPHQLHLDFDRADVRSIQAKFDRWIETPAGKLIAGLAIRHAYRLRKAGVETFSMRDMVGLIRYEIAILGSSAMWNRDDEGFLINNSFTSRLSRWIEREKPDLKGFFVKRKLRREE